MRRVGSFQSVNPWEIAAMFGSLIFAPSIADASGSRPRQHRPIRLHLSADRVSDRDSRAADSPPRAPCCVRDHLGRNMTVN
jgi:hypothetical protein